MDKSTKRSLLPSVPNGSVKHAFKRVIQVVLHFDGNDAIADMPIEGELGVRRPITVTNSAEVFNRIPGSESVYIVSQ